MQTENSSLWRMPPEDDVVDIAAGAATEPESAAALHCAVAIIGVIRPLVVVTVVRGEHHVVVDRDERVTSVTRVPGY